MQLLDECYEMLLLNEELKRININPNNIKKELNKQYNEYRQREISMGKKIPIDKQGWYEPNPNEEDVIKRVLTLINHYDKSYRHIFNNISNIAQLRKALTSIDAGWRHNIAASDPKHYLQKQPANIAFINILNSMFESKVRVPIKFNDAGFPAYPLHLVNRFLAMNVLEDLHSKKQIDDKTKRVIENLLFDEYARKEIGKEIDEYIKRTSNVLENPQEEIEPKEEHETEIQAPQAISKEDRVAMLKRLMEQ